MSKVLDSWAILAWLQDEKPASEHIQDLFDRAETGKIRLLLNLINAGEVYYRLVRVLSEGAADAFWKDLKRMPLELVSVTQTLTIQAARLKGAYPIAYADAFAAATARKENSPLVTGDPELKNLEDICEIEWLERSLIG